jgi:prolipoprotein diacylglyceryltransferase
VSFALLMGAIPSPSNNAIGIGPLQLRAYGLAIAVGVVVAYHVLTDYHRFLAVLRHRQRREPPTPPAPDDEPHLAAS